VTAAVRSRNKQRRPPIQAELRLIRWGPKGATWSELDGRRVLVDLGIPGELVAVQVDRRERIWRGVVEHVVEAAAERVAASCPYYERCGGCQLQHVDYPSQLEMKRQMVDRDLAAAGVARTVDRDNGSVEPWRYRRTAAIAIGWEAGFRPRGRRGIVEIRDCLISNPLIGRLADRLNDLLRSGALPNYHGKVWLDCAVIGSDEAPALQVVIQGIEGLTIDSHPELPEVARTIAGMEDVESVSYRNRSGEVVPLFGELLGRILVDGRSLTLPAGSFFQTNVPMLEKVLGRISEELELRQGRGQPMRHLADIYGGVGTFALSLAGRFEQVTLVELDCQAVDAARQTAQEWGVDNVDFVSRHAERALADLPPIDVAIVDPPRSGLGEMVIGALTEKHVPLIFYVSCSSGSLARDIATLEDRGYRIETLEMFDFYPQTHHVECLAVLAR
jgi:23S rRNA (uracil1939-C5)-methyltransferase